MEAALSFAQLWGTLFTLCCIGLVVPGEHGSSRNRSLKFSKAAAMGREAKSVKHNPLVLILTKNLVRYIYTR